MTTPSAAATTSTPLPPPGRAGAVLSLLAFPLWVACFVLLYGSLGASPDTDPSPEELHAAYLEAGAPVWIFGVLAIAACGVLAAAPAVIGVALARHTRRRLVPGILVAAAVVTGVLQLWNTLSFLVSLGAGPTAAPGWVAVIADGTAGSTLVNTIAWSASSLAVTLLGFALWRSRVVPRTGLVVGIVGAVLLVTILVLQFAQPMTSAILLFALGIALVRARK